MGPNGNQLVLAALVDQPLDRIELMKTLFLSWYRNEKPSDWEFQFKPYLYGPFDPELYRVLENLEVNQHIVSVSSGPYSKPKYYITSTGKVALSQAIPVLGEKLATEISEIAQWAARQGFRGLLQQVYREAPEFAGESIADI